MVDLNQLEQLLGDWRGNCKTWFEPDKLADESEVTGQFALLLDGPFVRHSYRSAMRGRPRFGEETLVYDGTMARFQSSWIDSFHMSSAIMFSQGPKTDDGFAVTGSYDVGPQIPAWFWRTEYRLVTPDQLQITAFNISPEGEEAKAVETIYRRIRDGNAV